MKGAVASLLALAAVTSAYIQLEELSYVQLQDRKGQLSLNASTKNTLAWDDGTNTLYVLAKEPARLTVFNLGFSGELHEFANHDLNPGVARDQVGKPNTVEFCRPTGPSANARLAIAYDDPEDPSQPGTVRMYEAITQGSKMLKLLIEFSVGPNPVDMEFGLDCMRLLVANTGRPFKRQARVNDPPGSVSKVDLPSKLTPTSAPTITNIGFQSALENQDGTDNMAALKPLVAKNFRRTPVRDDQGNVLHASQNVEPVSVVMAPNAQTAYVALPKNNAIARLNLDLDVVQDIFPSGRRAWSDFYMDASKADNAVHLENYRVHSLLQPVQVKWVVQNTTEWLVTLDSGFLDHIPEYKYTDHDSGKNLIKNGMITDIDESLKAKLQDDTRLGEAQFSTVDGLDETGAGLKDLYMFGGRGISIHDGRSLAIRTALVDNLERVSAQFYKPVHNSQFTSKQNTPQMDRDVTSPSTGPALSVMESGYLGNVKVLFLGGGSSGMIYTYVLVPDATCPQPFFHSVHRRGGTAMSWDDMYRDGSMGDIGITDMKYIGNSWDHDNLLIVTSATSNSVSVYRVKDTPVDLRRR